MDVPRSFCPNSIFQGYFSSMSNLYQRSIEIILQNQSSNGAFIASPNFPTYHFCWFRDASFVAYAMDLAGHHESARRFHQWAAERVNEREAQVRDGLQKARGGLPLPESDILHTRYRLDGLPDEPGQWPNFQLDGFGTWLWALREHLHRTGNALPSDWRASADLVAEYLSELWQLPCYDCWEEFPENVHPHTLAAVYGGLDAHASLTGADHAPVLNAIREKLSANAAEFGHFVKFSGSPAVDASLLGLAVPYGVVTPDDPRMLRTVEQMEQAILRADGLHRYAADTYYGGGAWPLLSAWLGWYYHELARCNSSLAASALEKAAALQSWVEAQAGSGGQDGWLPEQVPFHLNDPAYHPKWAARWGEAANPLLWSHAKYIILHKQC
jgi:GH15 family glucan-1,4-alpha-glucosidase